MEIGIGSRIRLPPVRVNQRRAADPFWWEYLSTAQGTLRVPTDFPQDPHGILDIGSYLYIHLTHPGF
jgi:hypothetical protein